LYCSVFIYLKAYQIDSLFPPVIDGGDGLEKTILIELSPDITVLEHEGFAYFINLRLFKGCNLLTIHIIMVTICARQFLFGS
jgi:hypothetical protein